MLTATNIRVHFGGVRAVDGVTLAAARGEIVGLVGPNGSGKTTFLNALTGIVHATGTVRVDGQAVDTSRPRAAARARIARVFQAPQMFEDLSCLENVAVSSPDLRHLGLASAWFRRRSMFEAERARWSRARWALESVGLGAVEHASPTSLAYGQQRLLELARALAALSLIHI